MSILYPRLPHAVAESLYLNVEELAPAREIHGQIYAPVGGRRATADDIRALVDRVHALASEFEFPTPLSLNDRIALDRRTSRLLVEVMDLSWSEAASPGIWSFLALVALPDVTRWRFGTSNSERWIASDLTRHTWARAWWRGTVFSDRFDLLESLSESDLNQILERRVIGGDPRLVVGLAEALLNADADVPGQRRMLIRESAARLRRRLAFIDARSLGENEVRALCEEVLHETVRFLPQTSDRQGQPG